MEADIILGSSEVSFGESSFLMNSGSAAESCCLERFVSTSSTHFTRVRRFFTSFTGFDGKMLGTASDLSFPLLSKLSGGKWLRQTRVLLPMMRLALTLRSCLSQDCRTALRSWPEGILKGNMVFLEINYSTTENLINSHNGNIHNNNLYSYLPMH